MNEKGVKTLHLLRKFTLRGNRETGTRMVRIEIQGQRKADSRACVHAYLTNSGGQKGLKVQDRVTNGRVSDCRTAHPAKVGGEEN